MLGSAKEKINTLQNLLLQLRGKVYMNSDFWDLFIDMNP